MRLSVLPVVAALVALGATPALAHHKAGHQIPPGQMKKLYEPAATIPDEVEHVCLVTTARRGDPYARITRTEWLPRPEALRLADAGDSFVIYHPSVNDEPGCLDF
jgi:hypothetical protein